MRPIAPPARYGPCRFPMQRLHPLSFPIPLIIIVIAGLLSTLVMSPSVSADPADESPPVWQHPVDAPVVDWFRAPSNPYGAGNRGLEYGTAAGQPVRAVADGVVVFAGAVGRSRFVVVAHGPALRSTYAFLQRTDVAVGDSVSAGQHLATANPGFHLTARLNGRYVDPMMYLGGRWRVRLIAVAPAPVGGRVGLGRRYSS